jgi:hypothetical protein
MNGLLFIHSLCALISQAFITAMPPEAWGRGFADFL